MLTGGLGFFSLATGSFITAWLIDVLGLVPADGSVPVHSPLLRTLLPLVMPRLWLVLVLPAAAWVVSHVVRLRPLGSAIGAVLTGELFIWASEMVFAGATGGKGALEWVARIVGIAVGVLLTRQAIIHARAGVDRGQTRAKARAQASSASYAEFAAEAERIAALHETKSVSPQVSEPPSSPVSDSAVAADTDPAPNEEGSKPAREP